MTSLPNTQRVSSDDLTSNIFEYINENRKSTNGFCKSDYRTTDVVFFVAGNSYHGHQKLFAALSGELRKCFELASSGSPHCSPFNSGGILRVDRVKEAAVPRVTIDAPSKVFEAVFNYCYQSRITISTDLVPLLYSLTKNLDIDVLQSACAEFLANNLTMTSIGILCSLVQFGQLSSVKNHEVVDSTCNGCVAANLKLTSALHKYLLKHSTEIVCSQNGQLSARLIVNLYGEMGKSDVDNQTKTMHRYDQEIALNFLNWSHQRLLTGKRLSQHGNDENVHSDDDYDGGFSSGPKGIACIYPSPANRNIVANKHTRNSFYYLAYLNVIGENRSKLQLSNVNRLNWDEEDAQLQNEVEDRLINPLYSNTTDDMQTQDIRITLDICDIFRESEMNGPSIIDYNKNCDLLTVCLSTGFPESETCLLAPTTLGVGTTTIWLAKLAGYLVSLSIKRCRSKQQQQLNLSSDGQNLITTMQPYQLFSPSKCDTNEFANFDSPSTPNDSTQSIGITNGSGAKWEICDDPSVIPTCGDIYTSNLTSPANLSSNAHSVLHNLNAKLLCSISPVNNDTGEQYVLRMLEARSGFGCDILDDGNDRLSILTVGGYTRKGCLNSVEIYKINENSELNSGFHILQPIQGPKLTTSRGRTAVVSSNVMTNSCNQPSLLYVCGGSTGSKDLDTVEVLTSTALANWFQNPSSSHRDNTLTHQSSNANSYWQPIANLSQARSSLVAVNLSGLRSGGGPVCDTTGSILVAGGVSGALALSSVEAYIPNRNEWINLPSMSEGRSEASAQVLCTRNLIVVAGGIAVSTSDSSATDMKLIEGLDPRCCDWMTLPCPNFQCSGQYWLRGSTMTLCPNTQDNLLLIGGYNGREILDSTWIFDPVAWKWIPGPKLIFGRLNSTAVALYHDLNSKICMNNDGDVCCALVFGGYNSTKSMGGFLDTIEWIS